MLAKSPVVLLTAALALFSQTLAAPAQNSTQEVLELDNEYSIDALGTDSPFITCLKAKDAYYDNGSMDQDVAIECRNAFDDNHQARSTPETPKKTKCGKDSRSLPSTSEKPKKSSCGKSVPNHFMEAGPFRDAVGAVCSDLADQLLKKGLEKGGNAIQHKFGNGFHKKNSWLEKNQGVIFEVAMNLTPQTRAALKAAKVAKATLNTLCHDGLTKLGTKGDGCTQELGYYKKTIGVPGAGIPADHATTTTVKNGLADLFINNSKDLFGSISMNWRNP